MPAIQFTPEYWAKVPRTKVKVKIVRITNMADGEHIEFVFDNGEAFQRRRGDLYVGVTLHANQEVFVETIKGELVTGMWVPEQGWAFRMSNEQLAEYAKKLAAEIHNARRETRQVIVDHLADAMEAALDVLALDASFVGGGAKGAAKFLAETAIKALEEGPQ